MWVEKNGPTWRIREESAGRKLTVQSGFTTKTAANAALVLLQADEMRGDALVPQGGRQRLGDFIDVWWPAYASGLKPSSRDSEGLRIECHIRPMLGHLALDEIDAVLVQAWVGMLTAGEGAFRPGSRRKRQRLAPKSVANCHGALYVIMQAAKARRLIRANPCAGTPLPERTHHEMRFLTDDEIARLLAAVPAHWRPLVLLLVSTGLRWGEAIGLKVGRVNLTGPRPKLTVVEQLQELATTAELVWTTPKSARGRRTVSFGKQTVSALRPLVAGRPATSVVFRAPRGGLVRYRVFRRGWAKWTVAAGLEGLRIHDLRHTHAAILISAGRPLSAISRRLGHSSILITDMLYGHIREEADDGMLDAIDSALAGVADLDPALAAEVADELGDDPLAAAA